MAKIKLPEKYSGSGYSVWSIRRTIREAVNICRWSPWHAHAWMEEAKEQLSLDAPFFDEYDAAVEKINAYWRNLSTYPWFNEAEFWSLDGEELEPRFLEPINP